MTETEIDELLQMVRTMREQVADAYRFNASSYTYSALQAVGLLEIKLAELEPFMRQRATVIPIVYPPARLRTKKPKVDNQSAPPWEEAAA